MSEDLNALPKEELVARILQLQQELHVLTRKVEEVQEKTKLQQEENKGLLQFIENTKQALQSEYGDVGLKNFTEAVTNLFNPTSQ